MTFVITSVIIVMMALMMVRMVILKLKKGVFLSQFTITIKRCSSHNRLRGKVGKVCDEGGGDNDADNDYGFWQGDS